MERNVVVAGWGQVIQPKKLEGKAKDPMGLMAQAAGKAAEKTISKNVLKELDSVMIVRTLSHHYLSPAKQLASKIGASPQLTTVSDIGGNSPQTLINIAAGMIARNELDSVLIAGAESYVQRGQAKDRVDNALFRGIPHDYSGDDLIGVSFLEKTHGIEHPMQGFPLFETALWDKSGQDLKAYLGKVGKLWASFSKTASKNSYAWSKTIRTPEQIITPGPNNRPVAFPYTKYMNSFVTVDQGAAIILMSEEKAKNTADTDKDTVYFLGGGYATDSQRFMIEKSDFTASPPLKAAVQKALTRSNMPLEKLECFDLYSCFPSAVSIAKKMIGIGDNDPRPLTLTGGLGFFGGPGNNYSLHSAATLAQMISVGKKSNGLITALGWFMYKHAAGVYSNQPLGGKLKDYDIKDQQNSLVGDPPEKIEDRVNETGIIETYTVIYSSDRQPAYAVIYGKTKKGNRFISNTRHTPEIYQTLISENRIGQKVNIAFDVSKNINVAQLI